MKLLLWLILLIPYTLLGQWNVYTNESGEIHHLFKQGDLYITESGQVYDEMIDGIIINKYDIQLFDAVLSLSTTGKGFFNGDSIHTLEDNSYYNNDASPSLVARTPLYSTADDTAGIDFDGDDDDLVFTQIDLGTHHSFSYWIYFDVIADVPIGNNSPDYYLLYHSNTTSLIYRVEGEQKTMTISPALQTGKWYHIVVTRDDLTVKLYIDGVYETSATLDTEENYDFLLNKIGGYSSVNFDGMMDDINIYTKVLNLDEIQQLYIKKHIGYGIAYYNRFADSIFVRMSNTPSDDLKYAISRAYDSLYIYDIYDSLDYFYCYAVHDTQAANLDWIRDTSSFTVNNPTFTAYEGYKGNGYNSYIKANYNLGSDTVNFRYNSATVGLWLRTNIIPINKYLFSVKNADNDRVGLYNDGTNLYFYLNSQGGVPYIAHGNNLFGSTIMTRFSDDSIKYARNNDSYTSSDDAVTNVPTTTNGIYLGANNNNDVNASSIDQNQYAFFFGGGQLTELQKTKTYDIMYDYLDYFNKESELTDNSYFYGNSTTIGYGLDNLNDRWTTLVSSDQGYIENNFAIPGGELQNTAPVQANNFRDEVDDIVYTYNSSKDSKLYINYGVNDIRSNEVGWDTATFKGDYREIIDIIVGKGWSTDDIIICSPNRLTACGTEPRKTRCDQHVEACEDIADEYSMIYIDMYNDFDSTTMLIDGVHPNTAGHLWMSQQIINEL